MSEPTINFNNNAGAVVNGHMGIVHGNLYFGPGFTKNVSAGVHEDADAEVAEPAGETETESQVDE